MCNALRGLPPLVERHLRDWCVLFSSGKGTSAPPLQGVFASTLYRTAVGGQGEMERESEQTDRGRVGREAKRRRNGGKLLRGGRERKRETLEEKLRRHEREIKWKCEKKSKRPTSVSHYPPGPLSGNRSIWHNSQQTSLWLQMGVDGRGAKVIQGKDTKGTSDLSHTRRKETGSRKKFPSAPVVLHD